nr:VOC family protein [Geodermatophilus chilensis]
MKRTPSSPPLARSRRAPGRGRRCKDLCLDARDHQALADWWCAALGYVRRPADRPTSDPWRSRTPPAPVR